MKRSMFRIASVTLSGSVAAALAVAGGGAASAAPNQYAPSNGTVSAVGSQSGNVSVPLSVKTSVACPATDTLVKAFINSTDAALTDAVAIAGNETDIANMTSSGLPLDFALVTIAQNSGKVLVNGHYDISVVCYPDAFGSAPDRQMDGGFTVTGGSATTVGTSYAFDVAAAPASTTALSVSPAGSANLGANVTLTANVTSTATVAGTVQFKSDGANLGAPVAVSGGSASFSSTALSAGGHALTADFIPTNPATISASSSNSVAYTIVAPAQATTTTLTSSPAAPTTADNVTLSATVAAGSGTPAGTVTFTDGTITRTGTVGAGGVASASVGLLTAGSHTFTASFAPANPASYLASTSSPLTVAVTAFAGVTAGENLTTTIPAGTLTMTTTGGTVNIPMELAPDATRFQNTSPAVSMNPVTVADTRAGSLGWTVNGIATDFANAGTASINSGNLGWAPRVVSTGTGQTVAAGPTVNAPATPVAAGAASTSGLKVSRVLASSPVGASVGTAQLNATLYLVAPTTTPADTYTATLTLTAL